MKESSGMVHVHVHVMYNHRHTGMFSLDLLSPVKQLHIPFIPAKYSNYVVHGVLASLLSSFFSICTPRKRPQGIKSNDAPLS